MSACGVREVADAVSMHTKVGGFSGLMKRRNVFARAGGFVTASVLLTSNAKRDKW
jgi:hypothetical protein